jgi:soluble lytic murein transglycosylase-like protein
VQEKGRSPLAGAHERATVDAVWPGRKIALGIASTFALVALAGIGCAPESPVRSLSVAGVLAPLFGLSAMPVAPATASAPRSAEEPRTPPAALTNEISSPEAPKPVSAVPPLTVAPVPDQAAPPARAPWQPLDVPRRAYRPAVERWRPLVRQLLAEMWDEGRLDGPASRLDDDLVLAVIEQESAGDPEAESWAGAIGLMQVMPFTFAEMHTGSKAGADEIDRPVMFEVTSNMRAGLRYLALAMNAHEGNVYWALASYNAGIEAVDDWRAVGLYAVPPVGGYDETANYAQVILRNYLRHRPDVKMHVPDPMPYEHVPGAIELLINAGRW